MKNISIIGKFLAIIGTFGLFAVCIALYSGKQISNINNGFNSLLKKEQTVAMYLSRSNRTLQSSRASIGDLLMSRSDKLNKAAIGELETSRANFVEYIDSIRCERPTAMGVTPILNPD